MLPSAAISAAPASGAGDLDGNSVVIAASTLSDVEDTPAVPSTAQTRALTAASASGAACPVISDGDESSSTSTVIGGSQPATEMPVPSAALRVVIATVDSYEYLLGLGRSTL